MFSTHPAVHPLPMGFSACALHLRQPQVHRAASRLLTAAANAAQSETVAAVPRQPNISDGTWGAADARLVEKSLADSKSRFDQGECARCSAVHPFDIFTSSLAGRISAPITCCPCAGTVLLGRSLTDLQDFAASLGQPKFRGKQLYDGLMHGAHSVMDINNVRRSPILLFLR